LSSPEKNNNKIFTFPTTMDSQQNGQVNSNNDTVRPDSSLHTRSKHSSLPALVPNQSINNSSTSKSKFHLQLEKI